MSELLPAGWVETTLNEIATWGSGGTPKASEKKYYDGDIPWLIIADLNNGVVTTSKKKITKLGMEKSSTKWVELGSILLAMYGSIGKLGIAGIRCATNQAIAFTNRIWGDIPNMFLFNYLKYQEPKLLKIGQGGAQKNISQTILKLYPFPLPPLNEQKRIVAKLDKIMPHIDSVKARLDGVPMIIKRFRQSVLTAAVTGKLTEKWREEHPGVERAEMLLRSKNYMINSEFKDIMKIPVKWCWCALGNYAQLSRGRFSIRPRNDPRYYDGNYPFIQIGDLPREGGYVKSHKQTLNEKGLKISKEFEKNTIAIAIVGATIGNTGILSYNMCFPDSLIGIETKTTFASIYTEYYLRTEKENIRNISYSSGGQPNIKLPTLTDYPFPLPPLEEQKEIVRQVDKLFTLADKLEAHYHKAKTHIDKLSQSVLAKAFRGELVPQDPNDEPAEKLLERIMEEKSKISQGPQRTRRSKKVAKT